jgi:hypothetical protein
VSVEILSHLDLATRLPPWSRPSSRFIPDHVRPEYRRRCKPTGPLASIRTKRRAIRSVFDDDVDLAGANPVLESHSDWHGKLIEIGRACWGFNSFAAW